MRVVVLGAGLLGVTSAYYLQQLGHEVTVVDRHSTPAAKARGRVEPVGALAPVPDMHGGPDSTARATKGASQPGAWRQLRGVVRRRLARLLDRAVGAPPSHPPIDHLVRLAAYSRRNVLALRDDAGVSRAPRGNGLLHLFTDAAAFHSRLARAPHWSSLGCDEQLLSPDEAVAIEPALRDIRDKLAGAAFSVEDPARDPAHFAASLVFLCRAAGVRFLTEHTVVSIEEREGRVEHVELIDADGRPCLLRAQAYVLALGASSLPHAEALRVPMPLRLVREYIVTLPVRPGALAPRVALRDRHGRLRISRIERPEGELLRVVATVRASADESDEPDSDRFESMLHRIEQLLPGVVDAARADFDVSMHAVSRNRLPMIGKTRLPNLFLNVAPGSPDWTHVCGAAKSIARIVSGLRPELDYAFRRP